MSNIDRMNGRRHAAQLLQDGAELETLRAMAAHHPVHFAAGMLDILRNDEVVAFLLKKRGGPIPQDTEREETEARIRKRDDGKYDAYVAGPAGDVLIGVYDTKDKARWARERYLAGRHETRQYPGLLPYKGGWYVRRRYHGKEWRTNTTKDYAQAVRDWERIDAVVRNYILQQQREGHVNHPAEVEVSTAA